MKTLLHISGTIAIVAASIMIISLIATEFIQVAKYIFVISTLTFVLIGGIWTVLFDKCDSL